jgi:hypothetical protein
MTPKLGTRGPGERALLVSRFISTSSAAGRGPADECWLEIGAGIRLGTS